ncbi:MAG TPA: energy transducer TonB [Longimicrobium sp.]|nr:energy transducer TonB [Longimicrobium sp.]
MRILSTVFVLLIAAVPAVAQPAQDSAGVYELHQVEARPSPLNVGELLAALRQSYPPALWEAGVEGTVQLSFVVGADGSLRDVRVVSATDSAFAAPTVQAVSLLRFSPAQVGGRPVAVRVEQPIVWRAGQPPAASRAPVLPDSVPVLSLDSVDVRSVPLNFREFEAALRAYYPADLRSTGATAQVLAGFAIDPRGEPQYVQVLESTDARFDQATADAIRRLRFQPARRGGAPVWVWMEVPVRWADPGAAGEGAEADTAGAYEMSAVAEVPRVMSTTAFQNALARGYPPALRNAGRSGRVVVRFMVREDGTVSRASVVRSTDSAFDQPSLEAVRLLRFHPARLDGRPVRVWVEQPIDWSVMSGPGTGSLMPRP